jgi:ParB family transcriptional regulator, chromosome partitioning protein
MASTKTSSPAPGATSQAPAERTLGSWVPTTLVHEHPENVRWEPAAADEGMVASIRAAGILEPLILVPAAPGWCPDGHGECFWTLAGNRRRDGAITADLAEVPAIVRDDLVTPAQQREFMIIENLHRLGLTPAEQAKAYEQLTFDGMDPDAIAAATGVSKATVKQRLRLAALDQPVLQRLHGGQLTIGDAEAFLEFAGDTEATESLSEAAGTPYFTQMVATQRSRRERIARHQALMDGFVADGVEPVTPDDDPEEVLPLAWHPWRDTELAEPDTHRAAGCLRYAVDQVKGLASYVEPRLACVAQSTHAAVASVPTAAVDDRDVVARQAERDRAAEERAAAAEAARVARQVRTDWIRTHLATVALPLPKKAGPVADLAQVFVPAWASLVGTGGVSAAATAAAFGVEVFEDQRAAIAVEEWAWSGEAGIGTAGNVASQLYTLLAVVIADVLEKDPGQPGDAALVRALWHWMTGAGYPLTEVDRALIDQLEVTIAEGEQ